MSYIYFCNVITAVFSSFKFKVRFKYNYFITAVPNCNVGNLGGQIYMKNDCISDKHVLSLEKPVVGISMIKKQKTKNNTYTNQIKPKKKFAYISVSREKYKDVWPFK